MNSTTEKLDILQQKLEGLKVRQNEFNRDINKLEQEIADLKTDIQIVADEQTESEIRTLSFAEKTTDEFVETINVEPIEPEPLAKEKSVFSKQTKKIKPDIEKFIGENLINKIGIAITIVGVAIGAKYSIEHNLISPLTRILIGYVFGVLLLGIGFKLKKKYENFSAVLVSGAMAIVYFITYAGFSFYSLFPQITAFVLMFLFTGFTVHLALKYNQQVIAHIGLVGAYAVPFLLSEGAGKVEILFTYMSIINIGILAISLKKYWKSLYYSSFILSWLVFASWYSQSYIPILHFNIALIFGTVFFLIFYISFLGYKLFRNKEFEIDDIILLLANSFLFYGFGYSILSTDKASEGFLGLFTMANAVIHLIASLVVFKQKLADKNLLFLIAGLVAVYVTITIPVQLDGNWVTLLWLGESMLLFYIGRKKQSSIYEKLSYPLMLLAFGSLIHDWTTNYNTDSYVQITHSINPVFNINFLTSILFVSVFAFLWFIDKQKKYEPAFERTSSLYGLTSLFIPTILIIVIYYTFYFEIVNYWVQLFNCSSISETLKGQEYADTFWNYDLLDYKTVWVLNYSLIYLSVLAFINSKYFKNTVLSKINLLFLGLTLLVYLLFGLNSLGDLRDSYLEQDQVNYYTRTVQNIYTRYISFVFLIPAILATYNFKKIKLYKSVSDSSFDVVLNIILLWVLSSELINILTLCGIEQTDKLGLSILWGIYSLFLIIFGIWKNKKHIRIEAITIFGITLLKLFVYDLSQLNTISKTIVFVSLGLLLLVISFLYNKYKNRITEKKEN